MNAPLRLAELFDPAAFAELLRRVYKGDRDALARQHRFAMLQVEHCGCGMTCPGCLVLVRTAHQLEQDVGEMPEADWTRNQTTASAQWQCEENRLQAARAQALKAMAFLRDKRRAS